MRAFELCAQDSSCWGFSTIWILVVPFVLFIVGGLLYDYIGEFFNKRKQREKAKWERWEK